ncbi:hypothetical protein [Streptomyces sp. NPDC058755]|uniref:hypothetical protein n=1 Tax=Streptomyces sp. NPDC058755 TaxID=3346624 RepID=UPI00369CEA90
MGVPRSAPLWRAVAAVHEDDWIDAQVAVLDYVPAGWPQGTKGVARSVRYDVGELPADPRSRCSRTVGKDQLALERTADQAYAYAFFATNEEVDLDEEIAAAEWEFRRRTSIEELFRNTTHGAGLSHVPWASHQVNTTWV